VLLGVGTTAERVGLGDVPGNAAEPMGVAVTTTVSGERCDNRHSCDPNETRTIKVVNRANRPIPWARGLRMRGWNTLDRHQDARRARASRMRRRKWKSWKASWRQPWRMRWGKLTRKRSVPVSPRHKRPGRRRTKPTSPTSPRHNNAGNRSRNRISPKGAAINRRPSLFSPRPIAAKLLLILARIGASIARFGIKSSKKGTGQARPFGVSFEGV
jgi:hypothetical protein